LKSLIEHFKSGEDKHELLGAARQIVKIWYLSQIDDAGTPDKRPVSSGHFQHGLLWRVIKAHPPAFSYQRHGYWAKKPA
jgi:hypothetical protein